MIKSRNANDAAAEAAVKGAREASNNDGSQTRTWKLAADCRGTKSGRSLDRSIVKRTPRIIATSPLAHRHSPHRYHRYRFSFVALRRGGISTLIKQLNSRAAGTVTDQNTY